MLLINKDNFKYYTIIECLKKMDKNNRILIKYMYPPGVLVGKEFPNFVLQTSEKYKRGVFRVHELS